MRKGRYAALLMAAVMSLWVGAVGITASAESQRETFTVGFDAEFPPYGYQDENGEYVGFDLSLAQEVCDRRGWELIKQPIDWDSKDIELESGQIDCIWNGFTMNGREDNYTWSVPYVDNSQVVVVKAGSGINAPADLAGKVVVVQADSSALAAFEGDDASDENKALAATFADLQQVQDYNSAFLNLESGAVDAICMDIGVAKYQVQQRGDTFVILDEAISSEQYGVGFYLGNTQLRDQVQETLYEMAGDGTFDRIAADWGLTDAVCLETPAGIVDDGRTTFTVGFDAEFPPYGYQDENGEYVGFDLSLAQEVCDRRGWELIKQPIDWDSKDIELESGQIDCIWNGFTMNGREDNYTWSVPYVDNSQVVVVKAGSGINAPADLAGKVVVVQADSSALAAFEGDDASDENKALAATFADLQQVQDYNSAFLNLESGAVDAICMDIGVAKYQVQQRGDTFVILDEAISSEQYGVGFYLGNTQLRDQVQETLYEMLDDGTFARIAEDWGLSDAVCLSRDDVKAVDDSPAAAASPKAEKSFGERFMSISKQLVKGVGASLAIFFLTLLFSLPLGLLVAACRMSKFKPLSWPTKLYISVGRGTPLMLQLLVVFFGPYYIFGVSTSSSYRFYAVIIGFTLNYAAYFAEIYRSGIQAVPHGQYEACDILGYSAGQRFFKIVFPQMVKNIIPSVTNEVITLVKDTSLAFAIAYTEMFTLAKRVAAAEATVMPLFIAGVFYYIFNFVVAFVMERIEKKMNYFR